MRFLLRPVLLMLAVAAPAAAQLRVESLEATHADGEVYRFPVIAGDSPAASRINTFLQVSELEKLPGRYRKSPFEAIWPDASGIGTTGMGYQSEAHQPGILSITIQKEWMGAYPSSGATTYDFDARTGEVITLTSVLTPAGLAELRQRVAQQRLRTLDEFLAGKPVDAGPGAGPVQLSSDPQDAEDQKELYGQCRDTIERDDLASDTLEFGASALTLRREPCAPHVIQALDDLGDFAVAVPYAELSGQMDDYGRCLLMERRADCQRGHGELGPGVYHGKIGGRYPITLVIEGVAPDSIGAAYFYDKHATLIPLRGAPTDDGGIRLDERGPPPARFELRRVEERLEGHWTQKGKQPLEVELH